MKTLRIILLIALFASSLTDPVTAGPVTKLVRETAESILSKFGRGVAGETVEEVAETTAKMITRYGDDALPLLRKSGHAGFTALKEAGEQAPDVIRFCAKQGDEAIWLISQPKKLTIFLKHGDSAGHALLKHPGIADNLIGAYGDDAVGALNKVSRQSAQRLNMLANEGLLSATGRSSELLPIIRTYGDEAMDFIWRNKGALAVTAVLVTFLADPEAYIRGGKELSVDLLTKTTIWPMIFLGILMITFLPFIVRRFALARSELKSKASPE
ncbi:MAG TPA: hypothetical protein PLU72_20025 [Candidatus Ozemobacteraceae bacterium]|nr:hypothetical protein [Candidatus Ozemobacteraceae bacterium]